MEIVATLILVCLAGFAVGFMYGDSHGAKKAVDKMQAPEYDYNNPINQAGINHVRSTEIGIDGKEYHKIAPMNGGTSEWL